MWAPDIRKCRSMSGKNSGAETCLQTKVSPSIYHLNLIKPSVLLAPHGMPMHVKQFSSQIQYGQQASVKVGPFVLKIQKWRPT